MLDIWLLLASAIGMALFPLEANELPEPKTSSPPSQPKLTENCSRAEPAFLPEAQMPKLVLLEGTAMGAVLESTSDGKLLFRRLDGKLLSLPIDQLVRWGWPLELQRGPVVVLADGSLLVAQVRQMAAMHLEVEQDLLQPKGDADCRVPVGQLLGVVFRLPPELTDRDRLLDRLSRQAREDDRLLLLNGDELRGRVEALEDRTVRFSGPLGPMSVEVSRIRAIQFRRWRVPSGGPETRHIWVGLRDGSLLLAQQLAVQQTQAELTLLGNLCFQTERDNLVFLQPIGGRLVYLSDLEPKQYQFEPFFELLWPYQRDRSVTGSWLRSAGRRYLKGLGVHSKASLKYALQGRYSRLEAELGLDDTSRGRGSVIFRVVTDGKEVFRSQPISSGDPPLPIRLDMTGVQELELIVDYGPWGDQMDRANWLEARLIPTSPAGPPPSESKHEKAK
ncbi:MAG: NPCBM/NEW2 domain-containing protein [Thermoguttaceae bacterium]|nr:NPCBM/NEW2 domain-containing protein [Thermoguttaceae bacterium]MDW8038511.1 NPCBM/NEW2 domain-containing protein [Thermoguttaceae bacterium]